MIAPLSLISNDSAPLFLALITQNVQGLVSLFNPQSELYGAVGSNVLLVSPRKQA